MAYIIERGLFSFFKEIPDNGSQRFGFVWLTPERPELLRFVIHLNRGGDLTRIEHPAFRLEDLRFEPQPRPLEPLPIAGLTVVEHDRFDPAQVAPLWGLFFGIVDRGSPIATTQPMTKPATQPAGAPR